MAEYLPLHQEPEKGPTYGNTVKLIGDLSRKVQHNDFLTPSEASTLFGVHNVPAYYFVHALYSDLDEKSEGSVPQRVRRDGHRLITHSFDAALKPFYRFHDRHHPSGYVLSESEQGLILLHDTCEEATTLSTALSMSDLIHALFPETGKHVDLLTNWHELAWDSIESKLKGGGGTDYQRVLAAIEDSSSRSPSRGVNRQGYLRAKDAVKYLRKSAQMEDMEAGEQTALADIIDDLSRDIEGYGNGGVISQAALGREYQLKVEAFRSILPDNQEDLATLDDRLIIDEHTVLKDRIKKESYADFVANIARSDGEMAFERKEGGLPRVFSPFKAKQTENAETASTLGTNPLSNTISIYRKGRLTILIGLGLLEYYKENEIDGSELRSCIRHHQSLLEGSLDFKRRYFENEQKEGGETKNERDLRMLEVMTENIRILGEGTRSKDLHHKSLLQRLRGMVTF